MRAVIPALAFVARHFLLVVLAALAGCVILTITYLLPFAFAVIADQGLGGPLAFPAGIIAVVSVCVLLGWGVFAPASAVGAVFCGLFKLPGIAAIPVVSVAAFLLYYLFNWAFTELLTTHPLPPVWTVLRTFAIYLSVPLGINWWLTEGPGALFDLLRRWHRGRRPNKSYCAMINDTSAHHDSNQRVHPEK